MMTEYHGIGVTQRIAIGRVFLVNGGAGPALPADGKNLLPQIAGFVAEEKAKLAAALEKSREQIRDIVSRTAAGTASTRETAEIIATQLDYFDDPAFNGEIITLIEQRSLSAMEAVTQITHELCDTFNSFDDDLVPSQTAQLDIEHVRGFVTETGSAASHTAIMARSIGIAAVVCCLGVLRGAQNSDTIIVDGWNGKVFLRPDEATIKTYAALKDREEAARKAALALKDKRIFLNGREIFVTANIGNPGKQNSPKPRALTAWDFSERSFYF
jgi:phosphoenolpyruvate-protein kinase (PTS system EI component)